MQVLREISSQTADSTTNTSQAIAKLAELSAGLRRSVAGFRLPEGLEGSGATQRALPTDPSASGSFRRVLGGSGS
jgi:hypothetical protein